MNRSHTNANRMDVWDHSMLNKLPGRSRKHRKRIASKKRPARLQRKIDKLLMDTRP